jgi:hypothetical protein
VTTLRLAWGGPPEAVAKGLAPQKLKEDEPALLVSYFYLKHFQKERHRYGFRDWSLDSGAFSANNSGKPIDLTEYIEACKELLANDPTLVEVFALDVIGDWKASVRNTEKMWAEGVPAIPVFHANDPWSVIEDMKGKYPKIAIGGVAGFLRSRKRKVEFYQQCFARVWPQRIHALGLASVPILETLPFHSVDAATWELGPAGFGSWRCFGKKQMPIRGGKMNLRPEVEEYLRAEKRLKRKWAKQMAMLDAL